MQKVLIVSGIVLLVLGLAWPWISKLGLGRLPGDIVIEREHARVYIPIVTSLVISVVLTLIVWLMRK